MTQAAIDPSTLWFNTNQGVRFTPFAPRGEDVRLYDIIHALSHLCRYAGHSDKFYSVAEHSVYVSMGVEHLGGSKEEIQIALMHDATEAYLVDLPSPVKAHPAMSFYRDTEHRLQDVVFRHFGLPSGELPKIVKYVDYQMLHHESEVLIPRKPADWNLPARDERLDGKFTIAGYTPSAAKAFMLGRFRQLFPEYKA
jgi:uncharacterized protein